MARTVIEGGRTGHNKFERREASRIERQAMRAYARRLVWDPAYDEGCVRPRRDPVGPSFADRFTPFHRFIDSWVGRRWDDLYAELRRRFDVRTAKGWHLVLDHFRGASSSFGGGMTRREGDVNWMYADWFIDADGYIRRAPRIPYRSYADRKPPADFDAWHADRKVGPRGARFFWFVPTSGTQTVLRERSVEGPEKNRYGFTTYVNVEVPEFVTAYRQDRALTPNEVAYYMALPHSAQAKLAADLDI
jgi:hypothetical protein